MTAAAISGTFSDYRLVRSRSVLQIIVEVPIEQQSNAFAALGYPIPGAEIHVALARLQPDASAPPSSDRAQAGKARYVAQTPQEQAVTRAAMLPKDRRFREWLTEYTGWLSGEMTEEEAAWSIRHECGVDSRRELSTDAGAYKAFLALESAWLVASGQMAEPR